VNLIKRKLPRKVLINMAVKAIYTKVDGTYYKVNQSTTTPSKIYNMPETHSIMNSDTAIQQVNSKIWINTISKNTMQTNKEAYDEMIQYFVANRTTQIDYINDRFLIYVDYTILDMDGKEVTHSVVQQEIKGDDALAILGVNGVCECIYKQVKEFNTEFEFTVKNNYPIGIMYNNNRSYKLIINDLAIYQDLNETHRSCDANPYEYQSHTIASMLEGLKKIYSSYDNGFSFSAVDVPFVPRKIVLTINLAIDSLIVVYDNNVVNTLLIDNAAANYSDECNCHDNDEDDTPVVPNGVEIYPEADGSLVMDNGEYDKYERTTEDHPDKLLVVSDDVAGNEYNPTKMVHISMITNDIPDITVGEYVRYVRVIAMTSENYHSWILDGNQ
jgi:hypothetical protein